MRRVKFRQKFTQHRNMISIKSPCTRVITGTSLGRPVDLPTCLLKSDCPCSPSCRQETQPPPLTSPQLPSTDLRAPRRCRNPKISHPTQINATHICKKDTNNAQKQCQGLIRDVLKASRRAIILATVPDLRRRKDRTHRSARRGSRSTETCPGWRGPPVTQKFGVQQ